MCYAMLGHPLPLAFAASCHRCRQRLMPSTSCETHYCIYQGSSTLIEDSVSKPAPGLLSQSLLRSPTRTTGGYLLTLRPTQPLYRSMLFRSGPPPGGGSLLYVQPVSTGTLGSAWTLLRNTALGPPPAGTPLGQSRSFGSYFL